MKKLLLFTWLIFCFFVVNGQDMGIIEVNDNNTATLVFEADIDFIVVANNPKQGDNFLYYDIFKDGKICVIRGNDAKAPITSITVKLSNNQVFFGRLKYGDETKILYRFTYDVPEERKEVARIIEEEKREESKNNELQKLELLMAERQEYFVLGVVESGVSFIVSNIRNDAENTYLKIIINNRTGGDYLIDAIMFKYVEGRRRGLKRREALIEERIMPKHITGPEVAKAYTNSEIGVIIPIFSVGEKGDLVIQLRERNGTRNPEIRIEGKNMLKVKIFTS